VPAAQVLAAERGHRAGDIGPGEHVPHFLPRRGPRGVFWFGEPPEPFRRFLQFACHECVVDVLEAVPPLHRGLVLFEDGDGACVLPVAFEGGDEFAEHRGGVRCQFERAGQRPDGQVLDAALDARVTQVVVRATAVATVATIAAKG
jgi:hypothetical protein